MSTLTWLLPTPCTKRWDELGGAGDRRSCETCGQAVVDLTERDAAEAARLLSGGEAPCARVWRGRDGRVWPGARTASVVGWTLLAVACSTHAPVASAPVVSPVGGGTVRTEVRVPVPVGEVWVSVVDESGLEIPGAPFTLGDSTSRRAVTLDGSGRAVFHEVPPGDVPWQLQGYTRRPLTGVLHLPADRGLSVVITVRYDDLSVSVGAIVVLSRALDVTRADHGATWSGDAARRLPR